MNRAFHSAPGRENARPHEEYARVKANLANRTDAAILLAREDLTAPVWVPKKALDLASRVLVEKSLLKTEVSLGVELQLAISKGLVR